MITAENLLQRLLDRTPAWVELELPIWDFWDLKRQLTARLAAYNRHDPARCSSKQASKLRRMIAGIDEAIARAPKPKPYRGSC